MPKREAARLRLVQGFCPSGSLLDLGSAHGLFGKIAHEAGYRVSLGDYVPEPQELGFALVVPVDLNRPNGAPHGDNSFDVVTFMSCIEHVMYADVAVAELARIAKPGGYIAMDTPLVGDWCERNFAHHSHWIGPPEHLNLFSSSGLRRLTERGGLEVVYHAISFERSLPRWFARKGRNLAVALHGVASRALSGETWRERRSDAGLYATQAGDIQMIVVRKPVR
jgi:SAM-dependent methyltransferase